MTQAFMLYSSREGISQNKIRFSSDTFRDADKGLEWYNNSIGKHLSTISTEPLIYGGYGYWKVRLTDGASFIAYIGSNSTAFFFYSTKSSCEPETFDGKTSFLFTFYNGKFMISYTPSNNKTLAQLLAGCQKTNAHERHDCTRLIQVDGWQIKDDYPWYGKI